MTDRRLVGILGFGAAVGGSMVAFACGSGSGGPSGVLGTTSGGDSGTVVDSSVGDTASPPNDSGVMGIDGEAGACSQSDSGATTQCSGLCTDLQTDINNCGHCGNSCSTMGASAECVGGACKCSADAGAVLCGTTCVETLSDPNNCGACGHTCQNSMAACTGGYCQPTVVAAPGAPIWSIVVDPTRVWWTQPSNNGGPGGLYRKPFGSGSVIDTVMAPLNDPRGLAIDLINVYWVDYFDTSVNQLETLGGHFITDWPNYGSDGGVDSAFYRNPLAVVVDSNNVYWVSNFDGDILSVPIGSGGSVAPTVIASGENHPVALAVDANNVYWADEGSALGAPYNGAVVQKAKTGAGSAITLASGEAIAWGVAVDAHNVYWIDHANLPDGAVKQVPIGGGTVVTLAQNEGGPWGIAIDSTKVYWTAEDDGTVNGIVIGGASPKEKYATQQQSPTAIAVDSSNIYWVNLEAGNIVEVTK